MKPMRQVAMAPKKIMSPKRTCHGLKCDRFKFDKMGKTKLRIPPVHCKHTAQKGEGKQINHDTRSRTQPHCGAKAQIPARLTILLLPMRDKHSEKELQRCQCDCKLHKEILYQVKNKK